MLGLLFGAGAAQVQGLEYLLSEGESRVIFSTHSHRYDDGCTMRGLFDGLVWIPAGPYTGNRGYLFMNNEIPIANDPAGAVTRLTYNCGQITAAEDRARNLEEAILWLGEEAENARRAFAQMAEAERLALLTFLRSL